MTLAKVNEYVEKFNVEHAVDHYQRNRQKYYEELSTFETFGRGWTRRVDETTETAKKLI
jgi:lysozyme family protein